MSSSELEAAEQDLEDAREALEEADAKVQRYDDLIASHEAEAEAADAEIQEALQGGADPSELSDLRRKRGLAKLEAEELRDDRSHLRTLVARRQKEVAQAEIEVQRIRWALCRKKAQEIGREVWERLLKVEELADELEALDASARRHKSIMDSRGYDGPWWPTPSQAAGLQRSRGWESLFSDLKRQLRRHREDAPLPATGTG